MGGEEKEEMVLEAEWKISWRGKREGKDKE